MYLNQLKPGDKAIIRAINAPLALKRRLLEMGFTTNAAIKVVKEAPLTDPVEYCIRGCEVTLRKSEAAHIEVERVC